MSIVSEQDPSFAQKVMELVTRERESALSVREWKHRLAGYGYMIRETAAGQVVETMRNHVEVCILPADLTA